MWTVKTCMKNISKSKEDEVKSLVDKLILMCGDDPKREGLKETPGRVVKMYSELLSGYNNSASDVIKLFDSNGFSDLVTASNIDFYSLCEHHMVPFFGQVHIGYVPNGKVLGLSKFSRIVDIFSKRLQTQENLTKQIVDVIEKYIEPKGSIVCIEAEHMCVSMRGVKKKGFITKTSIKRGLFKNDQNLVNQFYQDINIERGIRHVNK